MAKVKGTSKVVRRSLSVEALALREKILAEFYIEDAASLAVLNESLRALDWLRAAEAKVDAEGITVDGSAGPKANPALQAMRDSRNAFYKGMKALNLDVEPSGPIGRPRGGSGGR